MTVTSDVPPDEVRGFDRPSDYLRTLGPPAKPSPSTAWRRLSKTICTSTTNAATCRPNPAPASCRLISRLVSSPSASVCTRPWQATAASWTAGAPAPPPGSTSCSGVSSTSTSWSATRGSRCTAPSAPRPKRCRGAARPTSCRPGKRAAPVFRSSMRRCGSCGNRLDAQPPAHGHGHVPQQEPADRLARGRALVHAPPDRRRSGRQQRRLAVERVHRNRLGAYFRLFNPISQSQRFDRTASSSPLAAGTAGTGQARDTQPIRAAQPVRQGRLPGTDHRPRESRARALDAFRNLPDVRP